MMVMMVSGPPATHGINNEDFTEVSVSDPSSLMALETYNNDESELDDSSGNDNCSLSEDNISTNCDDAVNILFRMI